MPDSVPVPTPDTAAADMARRIRDEFPTPDDAPSRVMRCPACGEQRWVGYGPCGACSEPSPWEAS